MIVFAHPDTSTCLEPFRKLGYEVHIKDVPVDVTKIRGDFLREKVVKTGCCGDKEFIKLYAYTLVEYPIVVHLDLDSLVVQNMDELFDGMMTEKLDQKQHLEHIPVQQNGQVIPHDIQAFFTRDYNMVNVGHKHPGIQGGFIIVKPNLDYFEEYKRIIQEGNYKKGSGWFGEGYGGYYGAQQIQGLCSLFFDRLHPGTAVELNRCIYNSMNDNPYGSKRNAPDVHLCRDGRETCEDCREAKFSSIKSIHFTLCQKPWVCPLTLVRKGGLCEEFHRKWFQIRQDWENSHGITSKTEQSQMQSKVQNDVFLGFCKGGGERNYIKIQL